MPDRLIPASTGWQLLKADDSVETYTAAGLLSTVTTRRPGNGLAYDSSNRLLRVTGPFGHTLTFANDTTGRVVQMIVPDAASIPTVTLRPAISLQ